MESSLDLIQQTKLLNIVKYLILQNKGDYYLEGYIDASKLLTMLEESGFIKIPE